MGGVLIGELEEFVLVIKNDVETCLGVVNDVSIVLESEIALTLVEHD